MFFVAHAPNIAAADSTMTCQHIIGSMEELVPLSPIVIIEKTCMSNKL